MPADPRFIPGHGKTHLRVPEIHIEYPGVMQAKGHYVEVSAALMLGGSVAEVATQPRRRFEFSILPQQIQSEVFPLVNADTDQDGSAGYPQAVLNAWAAAIQAGVMPLSLMQVGLASKVRNLQRAHYALADNPPEPPDPAP